MKIALIDFDDSFTANILEVLFRLNHQVSIFSWSELDSEFIRNNFDVVVLGPGPGHLLEYKDCFREIQKLKQFPVLGVCLGHQILLHLKGILCKEMDRPLHGKSLSFKNSGEFLRIPDLKAQLYNSWAVLQDDCKTVDKSGGPSLVFDNGFLAIYHEDRWISCQFHPESVGTSYPHKVFESLLKKICIMT